MLGPHGGEQPIRIGQQSFESVHLGYHAVPEYQNPVAVNDGLQSVCDRKNGAFLRINIRIKTRIKKRIKTNTAYRKKRNSIKICQVYKASGNVLFCLYPLIIP